jgi:spore coat polysaccharide biosynthesis predicted glycosyltransferase SpsG
MRIDIWVESAGLGHVTRQINLMEHVRDRADMSKVRARFIVDEKAPTQEALRRVGHEFVQRDPDIEVAMRTLADEWMKDPPALFIMDSVNQDQRGNAHLLLTDDQVPSMVVIDDPADRDVECDLLVNALPALNATAPKALAGQSLRGVDYLILPKEYSELRATKARRDLAECANGFAFFGGADLENFTSVFLDAVSFQTPVKQWTLLVGPAYGDAEEVGKRIENENLPITMLRHVESMASALQDAQVAVLAAGNTLSEAAAIGTPAIVFSQNSVQAENAKYFARECGVVDLGTLATNSDERLADAINDLAYGPAERRAMSEAMMLTVDALGGRRIAEVLSTKLRAVR